MNLEEEFSVVEKEYFGENNEDRKENSADNSDAENEPDSFLELSLQHIDENKAMSIFLEKPCYSQKFNQLIPRDMILDSWNNFLDLQKDQQDLVIWDQVH